MQGRAEQSYMADSLGVLLAYPQWFWHFTLWLYMI